MLTLERGKAASLFKDGVLLGKVVCLHTNQGPIKIGLDLPKHIGIVRDDVPLHGFTAGEKDQEGNT